MNMLDVKEKKSSFHTTHGVLWDLCVGSASSLHLHKIVLLPLFVSIYFLDTKVIELSYPKSLQFKHIQAKLSIF